MPTEASGRRVRFRFHGEFRFERMLHQRRWSPAPERPLVDTGYERPFVYVQGAASAFAKPTLNAHTAPIGLRSLGGWAQRSRRRKRNRPSRALPRKSTTSNFEIP